MSCFFKDLAQYDLMPPQQSKEYLQHTLALRDHFFTLLSQNDYIIKKTLNIYKESLSPKNTGSKYMSFFYCHKEDYKRDNKELILTKLKQIETLLSENQELYQGLLANKRSSKISQEQITTNTYKAAQILSQLGLQMFKVYEKLYPNLRLLTQCLNAEQSHNSQNETGHSSFQVTLNNLHMLKDDFLSYTTKLAVMEKDYLEARNNFINANLRLAAYFAKECSHTRPVTIDDIQEANLGLITALDRFDTTIDSSFSTYAFYWSKVRIIKARYKNEAFPIHYARNKFFNNKVETLAKKLGHEPSEQEISKAFHIPLEIIPILRCNFKPHCFSIHQAYDGKDLTLEHILLASEDQTTEQQELRRIKELRATIEEIFHSFEQEPIRDKRQSTARDIAILKLRFGFDRLTPLTYDEIAEETHLCKERVRQVISNTLAKFKQYILEKKNKNITKLEDLISFIDFSLINEPSNE